MGYTIYWDYTQHNHLTFPQEFQDDVKEILNKAKENKIKLGNWEGNPLKDLSTCITDKEIKFNGIYPDSCETFVFPIKDLRGMNFSFCKTEGNIYSIVIMAILDKALEYNLISKWSSDTMPEDTMLKEQYEKLYKTNSNEQPKE